MLTIKVVAVGGLKEKYWQDAAGEYVKRLSRYCKLEIKEVPEGDIKREGSEIRKHARGHVILCDIHGEMVTSEGLAGMISDLTQVTSTITFVIGGSEGVGAYLDDLADSRVSFGRITLPHQLFRVILLEQIYRAATILRGEKYHK